MYFYRVLEETVLEMKVVPASPPWNLFRVDAEIPLRAWTAGEPQIRIRIQRPQTSQLRPWSPPRFTPFMNIVPWLIFQHRPKISNFTNSSSLIRGCPALDRHSVKVTILPPPASVLWNEVTRTVFALWTFTKCWPMVCPIKKSYWPGWPIFILKVCILWCSTKNIKIFLNHFLFFFL